MKLRAVTLVSLFGIGEGNEAIFFAMPAVSARHARPRYHPGVASDSRCTGRPRSRQGAEAAFDRSHGDRAAVLSLLDRNEAPRVDLELPGRSFDRRLGIDGLDGAGG